MKILILVTLLCFYNYVKEVYTLDLSFVIVNRTNEIEFNCIAKGSLRNSAIGWVFPINSTKNDFPDIKTKFVPNISNNFTCDFEVNSACNSFWKVSKWSVDSSSDLILDTRWEGFDTKLSSETAKENRFELSENFDMGLSVRTAGNAILLLCGGWNPMNYPCYYLNIGDVTSKAVYLRKYESFPNGNSTQLAEYKYYANILSEHEWRNFKLRFDENKTLSLIEMFSNKTVIKYTDKNPLKPLYLFLRSSEPVLWKIHKNYYLYTNIQQFSKLGPPVVSESSDICISLYVSQCDNCVMRFVIFRGGKKEIVQEIYGKNMSNKWEYIAIEVDEVYDDLLQFYVETKLVTNSTGEVFWAIDETRICNKYGELKISTLIPKGFSLPYVSCHSIEHQQWRPDTHFYISNKIDFPEITVSPEDTMVKLSWPTYQTSLPSVNYLLSYRGNDICSSNTNKQRTKSVNHIITDENEVVISNLVPYTHYNFTFSFILLQQEKNFTVNTLPSAYPTDDEQPKNVTIKTGEREAYMTWAKPKCGDIFGPLLYNIDISSDQANISRTIESTDNTQKFVNLEPYTNYSVEIVTLRNRITRYRNVSLTRARYNFTTQSAVAPEPVNVEVYSADPESLSIRYDLPQKPGGLLKYIQAIYCDTYAFDTCNSKIGEISPCKLWRHKYCIDIDKLISYRKIDVSLSLKNFNTHRFGNDVKLVGHTFNRIPGKPTNVTYNIVDCQPHTDYCHLNINWSHPYEQNGTIEFFNIILNETEIGGSTNVSAHIQEVFKVSKDNYLPEYTYQIKYIPYSTHYELSIQSVNVAHRSNVTTIRVKTADIGDHIDQRPKLVDISSTTLTFQLPELDWRLNSSFIIVMVQDYDENQKLQDLPDVGPDGYCNKFGHTWIAAIIQLPAESQTLIIGENNVADSSYHNFKNKALLPNEKYCVTFIVYNFYKQIEHRIVYYEKNIYTKASPFEQKSEPGGSYIHLYVLLAVLICIPLAFFLFMFAKRRKQKRIEDSEENTYETLPFEDVDNFAYNNTYDKLIHI